MVAKRSYSTSDAGRCSLSATQTATRRCCAEREAAHDRESHIGSLDKALDDAPRGWAVVDMKKKDWKRVFPE
jgi:hypothetical protein